MDARSESDGLGELVAAKRRPLYYNALVAYLADPCDLRTQKQFAEDERIPQDAVTSYLHNHREELFLAAEKIRARYVPQLRTAVMKAVFKNIEKSFNDRQLVLRLLGDLVETTKSSLEIKTPDEKRALIAQLMQGLSARMSEQSSDKNSNDKPDAK